MRLNSLGEWGAGIGGTAVSWGRPGVPAVIVAAPAGGTPWMDDDHLIYQVCVATTTMVVPRLAPTFEAYRREMMERHRLRRNPPNRRRLPRRADACRVERYNVRTGVRDTLFDHGANFIEAGGGVGAVWFGTSDPNTAGITTTTGLRLPTSGLGPISPDGAMAFKVDYQSWGPWDVVERDGSRWRLTDGDAVQINLLSNRRAVFFGSLGLTSIGVPNITALLPGGVWWLRVVQVRGEWFVLYQHEDGALVLHPFTSTVGYRLAPSGSLTYRPDIFVLGGGGGGNVRVVWASQEDEGPDVQRYMDVDTAAPRAELAAPPPPPPPPVTGTVTIADDWGPRIGLAPLTVGMRAIWSDAIARIQWLRSKNGVWQDDAEPRDPRVDSDHHITFMEPGHYAIGVRGLDAAGHTLDQTGDSRIVLVNQEPSKPEYPPMHPDQFWFGPTIASPDLKDMFLRPDAWAKARERMGVFALVAQNILSIGPIGPNSYEGLVEVDALRKLREWGVALALEMGSIKEEDWHSENGFHNLDACAKRIEEVGGLLSYVSMDEPLTAAQKKKPSPQSLEESADPVAQFIRLGESLGAKVGWLEAWPQVPLEDLRKFLILLDERGALPRYLHVDCDTKWALRDFGRSALGNMFRELKIIANDYGLPIGVFLAGYSHPTDMEYVVDVKALASQVHTLYPDVQHVCVQSWVPHVEGGLFDEPRNLPESEPDTHTALFNYVVELFS